MKEPAFKENENWDLIVKPKRSVFEVNIRDIFAYKDLLFLLVKRDFVAVYKQTILGPLWFIIQPVITAAVFATIFGRYANINTGGIPPLLFYMAGLTLWTYFADCLNKTSTTFISNASVFGKVYFPRLIIPLSILFSNLIKLAIQFVLFIIVWLYYLKGLQPHYQYLVILPLLILILAILGFGFGILISSLTTKYRDLNFLVGFGVQLLMYATIIFPVSSAPQDKQWILLLNPVSSIIETFKYIFLGNGCFEVWALIYSMSFAVVLLVISVLIFNKVEQSFMDTV
jgi:lipopolysaccharide transport system permease protein